MLDPGTNEPSLSDLLAEREWYDNHKIEIILACKRKAFWHLVGPPLLTGSPGPDFHKAGLSMKVGSGADFGTCCHAAHATYRNTWGQAFHDRVIEALGDFEIEWRRLFPNGTSENYHRLERGLQIMQAYFERFDHESQLYHPIDPEMAFAIELKPRSNEPYFDPFWFAGRLDGIDERCSVRDWVVDELKTTSSGAARRLKSLARSRQPKGYVWAAREILRHNGQDPAQVTGFLGDVILVAAQKTDFQRDYFPVSIEETESWRRQTINIVEEWRHRLYQYRETRGTAIPFTDWRSLFHETTEECHKYGQCPYWDLCQFGPSSSNLSEFTLDSWNPAGREVRTVAFTEIQE